MAMNKTNLTDEKVRKLKPTGVEQIIWDQQVSGLGVRVTAAGKKSFILKFRVNGSGKKPTLGACGPGALSVAEARALAVAWKTSAQQGVDPTRARQQERTAPSVADLCDEYMRRHGSRKRSGFEDQRKIDVVIKPRLGTLRVKDVSQFDIDDLHRKYANRPYEGNRVLALVSKMFSLAERWDWREGNPARGVERYPEEPRERFLTSDEIARLSVALSAYVAEKPSADREDAVAIVRIAMMTGARSGEVLAAEWDQFDLDAGLWIKPSSHTKQKRTHRVPLSPEVIKILERRERRSRFVFPGPGKSGHRDSIRSAWARIQALTGGIDDVRVHDLRHTYASVLVSSGVSREMIGALLGHTQAQTTMRYAHLYDDPLREATSRAGRMLSGG
jgi:integrase